jgi:hypothetical protein
MEGSWGVEGERQLQFCNAFSVMGQLQVRDVANNRTNEKGLVESILELLIKWSSDVQATGYHIERPDFD